MNKLKKKSCFHLAYFTSSRCAIQSFVNNVREKEKTKMRPAPRPSLAFPCDSRKPQNSGLICGEPGLLDSDRIHGASHQVPRWKGVPLFEYIPIKKSELRYTQSSPLPSLARRSCCSLPPPPSHPDRRPLSPFSPYSFPDPRPPTPFTSGFCLSSREKRQKKRERNRYVDFSPAITSLLSAL